MNAYVVINEFGNIFGIYEEFEDAWDRQEQIQLDDGLEVDIEEYVMNLDVDPFLGEDEGGMVIEVS